MRHKPTRTSPRHESKPARPCHGFTRLELMACLAGVALLAALALPALATTTSRSHVVQCLNNLRQMGRAVQAWGADHQNEPPWWTPTIYGGSFVVPGPKPGNAWYELYFMTNELATPRILACPADVGVLSATNFLEYVTIKQFALSYFLNLHTLSALPSAPVFGDRNLRMQIGAPSCSALVNNTHRIDISDSTYGWTNSVHVFQGNVVSMDGSVTTTTSEEVRQAFKASMIESGTTVHLLKAR